MFFFSQRLVCATRLIIVKVFDEMKFALNAIPETLLNALQVRSCFQDLPLVSDS